MRQPFDPHAFLSEIGPGRTALQVSPLGVFFRQGDNADATFYLLRGQAKLTVTSEGGKEATIMLIAVGDFIGEECLAALHPLRTATAHAVTQCTLLRVTKAEMIRVLHDEHSFSEMFLSFLLSRIIKSQAQIVDLLFNSSEKRLARVLLLMAEFGKETPEGVLIPKITQVALAEMVGTTRSRISHFLNRFRDLGYIKYEGRIWVQTGLLGVIRSE